ncbi:Hypothetical predicted protein [Mytilus galloprovincialis]|uniref:HTH CENPB-type domain-containing protein n=1 Tax=Mytilus galloprovincialis TaxID=29158 RepID=A0A8B6GNJ9_MYTGA|nr:Hypothetical predicted protein [Mytilus galloprovincialis]
MSLKQREEQMTNLPDLFQHLADSSSQHLHNRFPETDQMDAFSIFDPDIISTAVYINQTNDGQIHERDKYLEATRHISALKDCYPTFAYDLLDLRSQGYVVTRLAIRLQALTMAKKTDYETPTDLKASAGWCTRFMKRYGLKLRQRTHIAQKLPTDVEHKVANFHQFVLKERKSHNYPLIAIGNMDETPMTFIFRRIA